MTRNKQGVSLIVLVITIIVMIILAGAVIISLSNTGIIGKANNAVSESNLKEVQQLATLAWSEAYLDNRGVSDENTRLANIERAVNDTLTNQGIDINKFDIDVTRKGVTVSIKTASGDNNTGDNGNTDNPGTVPGPGTGEQPGSGNEPGTGDNTGSEPDTPTPPTDEPEGGEDIVVVPMTGPWSTAVALNADETKVVGATVSNGEYAIDIGTVVNYMPNSIGPTGQEYTGGWKILGTDSENRLLIVSTGNTGTATLNNREDVLNANTILQNVADGYKDGTIGIGARPLSITDLERLTGADIINANRSKYNLWNGGAGMPALPYGTEVTYNWKVPTDGSDPDYKLEYSYVLDATTVTGETVVHPNGFTYYDTTSGNFVTKTYSTDETWTVRNEAFGIRVAGSVIDGTSALQVAETFAPWGIAYSFMETNVINGIDEYGALRMGLQVHDGIGTFRPVIFADSIGVNDVWDDNDYANNNPYTWFPNTIRTVVTLDANVVLTASTTNPGTYDITLP